LIDKKAGQVTITYYTDPLCCWSWALEKHWLKLRKEHGDVFTHQTVLCGMIPDWSSYNDPMNSVVKPIQMGPVWMHASEVTHTPMMYSIWHEDPPSSSYPPCIAVKTASLQSAHAADEYLLALRKSLMEEGLNISKQEVLLDVAQKIGDVLDYEQFVEDWKARRGLDGFREDLKKARYHNIGRYPTLTFTRPGGKGLLITGYRPYETLEQALKQALKL
jgi:putative protein-disulfide isomerase